MNGIEVGASLALAVQLVDATYYTKRFRFLDKDNDAV